MGGINRKVKKRIKQLTILFLLIITVCFFKFLITVYPVISRRRAKKVTKLELWTVILNINNKEMALNWILFNLVFNNKFIRHNIPIELNTSGNRMLTLNEIPVETVRKTIIEMNI